MIDYNNGELIRRGRIEVVCGSMFSGKTEELIRRMKRAQFAQQKVEIFKPAIDTRYSDDDVVTHEGVAIHSTPVDNSSSILLLGNECDVIGIDEAQFFDDHLVDVCNELAEKGVRVIVAGLDMDFRGIPFGPMPALCAIADDVMKVHAICVRCGAQAYVSHRKVQEENEKFAMRVYLNRIGFLNIYIYRVLFCDPNMYVIGNIPDIIHRTTPPL